MADQAPPTATLAAALGLSPATVRRFDLDPDQAVDLAQAPEEALEFIQRGIMEALHEQTAEVQAEVEATAWAEEAWQREAAEGYDGDDDEDDDDDDDDDGSGTSHPFANTSIAMTIAQRRDRHGASVPEVWSSVRPVQWDAASREPSSDPSECQQSLNYEGWLAVERLRRPASDEEEESSDASEEGFA